MKNAISFARVVGEGLGGRGFISRLLFWIVRGNIFKGFSVV